ncbi:hypothetical protein SprV_0702441200 [Sparganum proliferum]
MLEKDIGPHNTPPPPNPNFTPNSILTPIATVNTGAKLYQGAVEVREDDTDFDLTGPDGTLLQPCSKALKTGVGEEAGSDRHPKFALRKLTRGKQKIPITFMHDRVRRCSTFSKRKNGLMKKAHELSELTGADVLLVVASPTNHVYTYFTKRLRGMVMSDQGRDLIYSCLGATQPASGDRRDASGQTTPLCSSTSSPTRLDHEDQPSGMVSSTPPVEGELQQAVVTPVAEQTTSSQGMSSHLLQPKPAENQLSPLLNCPQPLPVPSTGLTLPTVVLANADNAQSTSTPPVSAVSQTAVLCGSPESSPQTLESLARLQDVTHLLQFSASGSPGCLPSGLVIPVRLLPNPNVVSSPDEGSAFSSASRGLPMVQIQAQTNTNSK